MNFGIMLIIGLVIGIVLWFISDRYFLRELQELKKEYAKIEEKKRIRDEDFRLDILELIYDAEKIPVLRGRFEEDKIQLAQGVDEAVLIKSFFRVSTLVCGAATLIAAKEYKKEESK